MTRHDARPDQRRGHRADEARRHAAQRRPRRDRRRAGRRRRAPGRPHRRGRASTCSRPSHRRARRCSTRPNTLLTPHLGASTAEAQVAVAEEVAEQILEVLDGRPARYAVNAPLLTAETAQAIAPYLPLAETLGRFLGAVRPRGAADADARDRRRAGGVRRVAARRRGAARPARDVHRPSASTSSTPATIARARGHHGRRAQDVRPPAPFSSLLTVTGEARRPVGDRRRAPSPTASRTSSGSTSTRWTSRRRTRC